MSNIMIDRLNKITTAAKALEDALNDYGGIVDVEVGRDGTQSVWASESGGPYSYKVALNARISITEDGKAGFAGREPDSFKDMIGYMVTAIHGGESVQNIVAITKGRDYSMSAAEREAELMAAIEPLAKEKFGPDVNPKVSWVRAQEAKLDLSALSH